MIERRTPTAKPGKRGHQANVTKLWQSNLKARSFPRNLQAPAAHPRDDALVWSLCRSPGGTRGLVMTVLRLGARVPPISVTTLSLPNPSIPNTSSFIPLVCGSLSCPIFGVDFGWSCGQTVTIHRLSITQLLPEAGHRGNTCTHPTAIFYPFMFAQARHNEIEKGEGAQSNSIATKFP